MHNENRRTTNILLWTVQVLLAALFLFSGVVKLRMSAQVLAQAVPLPVPFIRFIATAEVFGAIGLILPGAFRIAPELTPLAAAGLAVIMVGATVITAATQPIGAALLPFVAGVLAATVANGRWRVAPLPHAQECCGAPSDVGSNETGAAR